MATKKPPLGKMPKSNMKEELAEYGAKGKRPFGKKPAANKKGRK